VHVDASSITEAKQRALLEEHLSLEVKRRQDAVYVEKSRTAEAKQRALLEEHLRLEEICRQQVAIAVLAGLQPEPPRIEKELAERYANMSLADRAFGILKDLGMIEETPIPSGHDYDHSKDDEFCS